MKKQINWDTSQKDARLIKKIVRRAFDVEGYGKYYPFDKQSMKMDITATHLNGNPLRLEDFLKADRFNFMHDISGICNCIDRATGKLTRNFLPRFTQHEK